MTYRRTHTRTHGHTHVTLLLLYIGFQLFFCIYTRNSIQHNQGAIQWSKGTTTKKMRWIDLRENLVRENLHAKTINVSHIPGKINLSDIFTKEFRDTTHFLSLRNSFMISPPLFSTGRTPSTKAMSYLDALTHS